jgi:hypothetical protein
VGGLPVCESGTASAPYRHIQDGGRSGNEREGKKEKEEGTRKRRSGEKRRGKRKQMQQKTTWRHDFLQICFHPTRRTAPGAFP